MFHFSIRELILVTCIIAILCAWAGDHYRLAMLINRWQWRSLQLKQYIEDEGVRVEFEPDGISMEGAYGFEGVTSWFPEE